MGMGRGTYGFGEEEEGPDGTEHKAGSEKDPSTPAHCEEDFRCSFTVRHILSACT